MSERGNPTMTDDTYAVPMGDRWMIRSGLNARCALVNRAAVNRLSAWAAGDEPEIPSVLKDLWQHLTEVPAVTEESRSTAEKTVIIPTRSCNMRCLYCDFDVSSAGSPILDPRLACLLVDAVVAKRAAGPSPQVRIHFFGGEPLVARQCVETVVHYARMACARTSLTPWFEITTNGLFDESAVPFVGDYMDSVVISLDGPKKTHDLSRRRADGSGTYSAIAANIRRLSRFPVEVSLRTCVTSQTVDSMAETVSHFCREFEFDLLCFESLAPNPQARTAGLDPPDPCRFAKGVLVAESIAASHGVRIIHGPSELVASRTTSCPVGRGTLMLHPDGTLMACYLPPDRWTIRGLNPIVGWMDPAEGPVIEQQKLDAITALVGSKPRCAHCFCRHTCAGGCHVDQTPPGCALEYDNRCRATRVITAGRLLRSLEGTAAAEAFALDNASMQRVANHPDDRLSAWAFPKERAS